MDRKVHHGRNGSVDFSVITDENRRPLIGEDVFFADGLQSQDGFSRAHASAHPRFIACIFHCLGINQSEDNRKAQYFS
jgi:hypothetical protein